MVGRALRWGTPFAVGLLCACGSSSRSGVSRGNGTPEGGTSGAAGSSTGGTSGLGGSAGIAGSGGTAGSAGSSGTGGKIVDPSDSASWTWEECGRIAGELDRGPRAAAPSPTTPFAVVTGDGSVLIYPLNITAPTVLHGPVDDLAGGLGYSRDGDLLAEARDSTVIWNVADRAVVSEIPAPATGCRGTQLTFSEQSDYVLRYGDGEGCIFSTMDGELVARLPGLFSAAFRDDTVLATGCSENPAELCIFDLAGDEQSRIALSGIVPTITPSVAPLGDAIVGVASTQAVAWEPETGRVRWSAMIQSEFAPPVFTPTGDRVLVGDHLYDVSNGTPILEARGVPGAVALTNGGTLVLTSRPAVFDLTGASVRVFASNSGPLASLDISDDGSVLVTIANVETIAWQVAEDFASSTATFSILGEGTINVDVSADARWVAVSGDVRFAVDAAGGRMAWRDDAFPEMPIACLGSELRFSPDSRLLVGKRYATTVDVFDATPLEPGLAVLPPSELLTRLPTGGCGQGIAFSADGSELATPEATFPTSDFPPPVEPGRGSGSGILDPTRAYIEASPSGGPYLVTVCTSDEGCRSSLGTRGLAGLGSTQGGSHPRFSSEGHWIVSGGKLLHLPTDAARTYDENATEALFAPNGDIIAGERDGSLVRFCRRD